MPMTFRATALIAALSLSSAHAAGFYVGANVGASDAQSLGNAASAGIYAGYAIDSWVTLEAGYNRLGRWLGHDQGQPYTTIVNNVDVSLTAGPRFDRRFRAYGRIGFVDWSTIGTGGGGEHRVTGSSAQNDMLEELHQGFYGVGVSYRLRHRIGLRLEYRIYRAMAVNGHDLDISSLLLGATYHFG
ncbi:MAG: porin family protein [Acidiferrobacter sp.]